MATIRRKIFIDNYRPREEFEGWSPDSGDPRPRPKHMPGWYQQLRPEVIFDLLEKAHGSRKGYSSDPALVPVSVNHLMDRMLADGVVWTCVSSPHEEGFSVGRIKPDLYTHFGIEFKTAPKIYHVKCHEHDLGGLVAFMVTYIDKSKAYAALK